MRFVPWSIVACGCAVIARCLEAGNQDLDTWMAEEEDGYFLDSMDNDTWPDHLSITDNEGDPIENPQINDTSPGMSGNFVVASHLSDQQLSGSENNTASNNLTLGERLPGSDNNSASNNLSLSEKLPGSDNSTASNNLTMSARIKKFMGFDNATNAQKKQEPSTEQKAPQDQQVSGHNNMTSEPRVQSPNETSGFPELEAKRKRREALKDLKVPKEYVKPYKPEGLDSRNISQNINVSGKPEIPRDSKTSGNKSSEPPKVSETFNITKENTSSSQPPSKPKTHENKAQSILPVPKLQKTNNNNPPEGLENSGGREVNTSIITELKNATGADSVIVNNITIFENITIPRNVTVLKGINVEDKNGTSEIKKGPLPKHGGHSVNHIVVDSKHNASVPASTPKPKVPVAVSHPKPKVPVPASYPGLEIPVPVLPPKHKKSVPAAHSKHEVTVSGSHPKPEEPFLASHPGVNTSVTGSHPLPEVPIAKNTSPAHGWMQTSPPHVAAHKAKKNITRYPHAARFSKQGNTSSGVTSVAEGTDTVIVPHNLTVIVNTKP
ncbi:hypothetical protein E2C01_032267 [Portunus trituberculatus]|uniref:Uncharacterized protein n=1 Tax=Portunus trituberculatus TaxID=210409 RepID=A0A5B7F0W3_PORTR|nr:hypothetical protein [Portunus trituberculatus]